ncbi:flagellar hook-basal body complex protein FliE [Pelagicoccus sp. SDUM812005]|uniref:flagellar hook-basal body complex protein FliE n=1 Tax=Pelagicoccus sp. SDUM812005 TaxID=3041257 RepID=UPI00280CFACF|nr:flagellar hook-basal body complex protein FliE [Pelagicoccus sp. SDUM812005]MDQ8182350.1 flagellar hook-basal body complex protein FliE [Pelagicoccus sp. SDUM812005]
MIDSVSNLAAQQLFKTNQLEHQKKLQSVEFPNPTESLNRTSEAKSFEGIVGKFVGEVDAKHKVAVAESNRVLLGEADNVHQAMIASQEAGVAFNMMVEVRNKLVQSYQELMKMPV